jgi:hypothetical protein
MMDNEFTTENTPKANKKRKKVGFFITGLLVTLIVIVSLVAWSPTKSSHFLKSSSFLNINKAEDNKAYYLNEVDSHIYCSDIDGKNIVVAIDKEVSSFDTAGKNIYFTLFSDNNIYTYDLYTKEVKEYMTLSENSLVKKVGKYLNVSTRTMGEEKLIDINTKEEKSMETFLGKEYASFTGAPFSRVNMDFADNYYYFYLRDPATEEFLIVKINSTGTEKDLLYKGKEDIFYAKKQYTQDNIYFMMEMKPTIYDIYKVSTQPSGISGKVNAFERVTELETYIPCYSVDAKGNMYILSMANDNSNLLKFDGSTGKVTELKIANYINEDISAVDMHMFDNYLYLFSTSGAIRVLDLNTNTMVTRITDYIQAN